MNGRFSDVYSPGANCYTDFLIHDLLFSLSPGFPGQIPQSRKTVVCVCVFSPYLHNEVSSELTTRNPLSRSRLACSRLSGHIQPSVNRRECEQITCIRMAMAPQAC